MTPLKEETHRNTSMTLKGIAIGAAVASLVAVVTETVTGTGGFTTLAITYAVLGTAAFLVSYGFKRSVNRSVDERNGE